MELYHLSATELANKIKSKEISSKELTQLYIDRIEKYDDDINAVVVKLSVHALPEAGRCSRGNRNTPLLLLLHPVHGCRAIMHFTNLVRQAGVEKNTLSGRGFTRVHMSADTDISVPVDGRLTCHVRFPV